MTDLLIATLCNNLIRGEYLPPTIKYIENITLSGSRAYNLNSSKSDYDLLGIHLLKTEALFDHPSFFSMPQVFSKSFTSDLEAKSKGSPDSVASIDSYELFKFTSLWHKGATATLELLYGGYIVAQGTGIFNYLKSLMKQELTTGYAKSAIGVARHEWRRNKKIKTVALSFHRLAQSLLLYKENHYEIRADKLFSNYPDLAKLQEITNQYKTKRDIIFTDEKEIELISNELNFLVKELDKEIVKFPTQVSNQLLQSVLKEVKQIRAEALER